MKTRLTRILTSFALLFAILAGNITTVLADNGDIATYGMVCVCGQGTYQFASRDNPEYGNAGSRPCTHRQFGYDKIETREVHTVYKCNFCGRTRQDTQTQTRITCNGYDF